MPKFFIHIRDAAVIIFGMMAAVVLVIAGVEGGFAAAHSGLNEGLSVALTHGWLALSALYAWFLGAFAVALVAIMWHHNDDPELGDG